MDFWDVYGKERTKPNFGSGREYITSRDRIHLSLSTVEQYGTALAMNNGVVKKFSEAERYILASEITHDMFLSIFDVNTEEAILLRLSEPLGEEAMRRVKEEVGRMKRPNLEMRVIGLQDHDNELLSAVDRMHNMFKSSLMEVDIFGTETRHIVFDMKLGMSFNLLLLDRTYMPYELVNSTTPNDFEKRKSELEFV